MEADNYIIRMLGYSPERLQGLSAGALLNKDLDGIELLDYLKRRDPGITGRYETRLIRADGGGLDVLISADRMEGPRFKGAVLIIKDMSDETRVKSLRLEVEREYALIELQSALLYLRQTAASMMTPALCCSATMKIESAVRRMESAGTNCFVVIDPDGRAIGIVTDQDLRTRVISGSVRTDRPVFEVMSSPVISAGAEMLFFEVFRLMREKSVGQLAVLDEEGRPIGVVTEKEMLSIQGTSSASLFEELKSAGSIDNLRDGFRRLSPAINTLVKSGANAANITRVVSRTAAIINERLIEIILKDLPTPPVRFAFLALGSEGRGEQTLYTDQDNAIIFADPSPENLETVREYFLGLGRKISDALDYIGYSYCKGGVMACNAKWCLSETEWLRQFSDWVSEASPEQMLDVNIVFDFKCSYGEKGLARNLRNGLWEALKGKEAFFTAMASAVSEYRPPLTAFGRIQVDYTDEDDEVFDIKKAVAPIVVYARTRALKAEIPETGTVERLERLFRKGVISEDQYRSLEYAWDYLTVLRFRDQVETLENGEEMDNLIYVEELMDIEIMNLRKIFSQIASAQNELKYVFTGAVR